MKGLAPYLPPRLKMAVLSLPDGAAGTATELRLRRDGPVSLTVAGKNLCFDPSGRFCPPPSALRCDGDDISGCISLITGASLYSYGESLRQGYIPFGDGYRAGICGEGVVINGTLTGFNKINGINLRVRRFVKDFGYEAARRITEKGLRGALVCSPPNRGKTTLLKSVAFLLSTGALGKAYRVGLADERGELSVPRLKEGLTDAIVGVKKSLAIELLCRSMSPEVLICDELAAEDAAPLSQVVGMGVCLVASAHASGVTELKSRPFINALLQTGAFPLIICLGEGFDYRVEEYK